MLRLTRANSNIRLVSLAAWIFADASQDKFGPFTRAGTVEIFWVASSDSLAHFATVASTIQTNTIRHTDILKQIHNTTTFFAIGLNFNTLKILEHIVHFKGSLIFEFGKITYMCINGQIGVDLFRIHTLLRRELENYRKNEKNEQSKWKQLHFVCWVLIRTYEVSKQVSHPKISHLFINIQDCAG